MSKPKPGLGKGIVRTLVNHPPVASSTLQLVPSVGGSSSSSGVSGPSSSSSSAAVGGNGGRREFATLGLPRDAGLVGSVGGPSSSTAAAAPSPSSSSLSSSPSSSALPVGTAGSSPWSSLLPSWDDAFGGDIVIPYRVAAKTRHSSSPSSLSTSSTPTSSASRSATKVKATSASSSPPKRGLSTLSPHSPSLDVPPSLFPSLVLPSHVLWNALFEKSPSYSKNTFLTSDGTSLSVDFITSPPSPPPTLRTRQVEVHPALSPVSTSLDPTSAPTSSSSGGFYALGIPHDQVLGQPSPSETDESNIGLYSSSNLIFHLGASGLPKDRTPFAPPAKARAPPLPHRPRSFPLPPITAPPLSEMKSVGVGEDAYFTRVDGMCIADGVGSWARSGRGGADAGRWSKLLTHFCEVELDDWWQGRAPYVEVEESEGWAKSAWEEGKAGGKEQRLRRPLDPVEIMQRGYEKCLSCFVNEGIHGSSTCLLAALHHSTLSIANMGDSCILVIRSNEIIFRSEDMVHAFNFPIQLGTQSRDEPMKDAKRYDVKVSRGDVVVLGSDGLMDNLFDEDILETLAQFQDENGEYEDETGKLTYSPQQVSDALCQRARAVSEQTSATTPFMVRAIDEGIDFVGGKRDDITVVVGVVGDREGEDGLALHTH